MVLNRKRFPRPKSLLWRPGLEWDWSSLAGVCSHPCTCWVWILWTSSSSSLGRLWVPGLRCWIYRTVRYPVGSSAWKPSRYGGMSKMEDRPPSTVPEICSNRSIEQSSQEFCCGALNSIQAATHNWRVDVCSSGGSISCKACNRDLELFSISPGWRLLEAAAGVPSSQNGIRNPAVIRPLLSPVQSPISKCNQQ